MPIPFSTIDDIVTDAQISYEDLLDKKTVQGFKHLVGECYLSAEAGPAQELINFFDNQLHTYSTLQQDSPEVFKTYQDLRWLLVLVAMAVMPNEEIRQFFTKHFLRTLDILPTVGSYEPDVRDDLDRYFSITNDGFYKGKFRQLVSNYLQQNEEKLGDYSIQAGAGGTQQSSTLGNWIKDYERYFPSFTVHSSLERLKYLNEGVNSKKLNQVDKARLTRILEAYDFVRFPVIALKEMGRGAMLERTPSPPAAVQPVKSLSAKDLLANVEAEFTAAAQQIRSQTEEDPQKLIRIFYDNLFPVPGVSYDRRKVVGSLALLASSGMLIRILTEPSPIKKAFVQYLQEEKEPKDLEGFNLAPISPLSVGKFLKFVLMRRLKMGDTEAAQIAVHISNILKSAGKTEYMGMAYYDQEGESFKWKV